MPNITPDLSTNIIETLYLLFAHNYIVFAYILGLFISIIISLTRPSRQSTFLLLGFALLTFSYEYDKHIISGLRDQTMGSLITSQAHYTAAHWINLIIGSLMPIIFYMTGWIFVYAAIIFKSDKKQS